MTGSETARAKLEFEKVLQRILRFAVSDPGRDLLAHLRILESQAEIRQHLSLLTDCKRLLEEEEALPLEGIFDIQDSLAKASLEGSVLLPEELSQVGSSAGASRQARAFMAKRREMFPLLWEASEDLYVDKVLEFNISQAIDESGSVRDSASKELQSIRRSIAEHYETLRKRLDLILRQATAEGFTQDEIITTREGRMVIPVKAEHKHRVPGFVHSASSSGATVFVEPAETLEMNNAIRSLHFQEQREVQRILRALTAQVRELADPLRRNQSVLAELDALQAKARYSIEILGVEPHIAADGPIRLHQARHPILMIHHGLRGTVPLDLTLGEQFRTLVISGPNAGGKSVAMKCVGLLVLMAQAGLHIPAAEESEIRPFRRFFVTIGDEQSIESDLSTFSSHLKALKEIADHADDTSLVLIDEIGAGTDPAEGSAIAAALLGSLTDRRAFTIATTHQGFLKVFAHDTEGVENGAMEFDIATLTPTYRYREGIPGSSYALEMAERIGMDDMMMSNARSLMGGSQSRMESLLTELEASVQEQRRRNATMVEQQVTQEALLREYEERMRGLAKEIRARKQEALAEAKAVLDRSNAMIERLVKEIRESGARKEVVSTLRQDADALRHEIESAQTATKHGQTGVAISMMLSPGSIVELEGSPDPGEVVEISADGQTAVVLFGSIRMKVPVQSLRTSGKRRQEPPPAGARSSLPDRSEAIGRNLDLRGMTGDEALPLIDKLLDDAFLAGLRRIDIIHGKGTGALRKKVTQFLAEHQRVASFRPGEWNEGGLGVTIVEIKEL